MWRTLLTATLLSISLVSTGVANDPGLRMDGLMANPSDPIPPAPTGHRQPTPSDLVSPKPVFDGTVGENSRSSNADEQINGIDRQIIEENKEVDRMINRICRGC